MGNLRRLGIEKGEVFAPDDRALAILQRAARRGHDILRAMAFNNRFEGARIYPDRQEARVWPDRQYAFVFIGGDPTFENDVRHMIDERVNFAHQAFSTGFSMTLELVGQGSAYFAAFKDGSGGWLNGSGTYRLRVPNDVPARTFWAANLYDTGTRSMIDNDQGRPGIDGSYDLQRNEDGSVDLYFGPEASDGMESNWVQTIPDRGFFMYFRLYGA